MRLALEQAKIAQSKNEVPVGAVIVRNGQVIATAYNQKESLNSPTAHAEILAIEAAAKALGAWRLTNCELYVTLEPCLMCAGAIIQSRLSKVIYGAFDPKGGAVQSLYEVLGDTRLNHQVHVVCGILKYECGQILTDFFKARRQQGAQPGAAPAEETGSQSPLA
jgi:tRNA(adenine34) deaminase